MHIAVFDLETNGTSGSSVLSASSIVLDERGFIVDIFNRFYFPQESLNPYTTAIHGLTLERIMALRDAYENDLPPFAEYFIDDWDSLASFWEQNGVDGIIVHNLSFDTSFLPELVQKNFKWWCSMKGLTSYCALPQRQRSIRSTACQFKYPKLGEAVDVICNGPQALLAPERTIFIENSLRDIPAHVSLFDCFELYRIAARLASCHADLMNFAPYVARFRPPRSQNGPFPELPRPDEFTRDVLNYERLLRALIIPQT